MNLRRVLIRFRLGRRALGAIARSPLYTERIEPAIAVLQGRPVICNFEIRHGVRLRDSEGAVIANCHFVLGEGETGLDIREDNTGVLISHNLFTGSGARWPSREGLRTWPNRL